MKRVILHPICRVCGVELNAANWHPHNQRQHSNICIQCCRTESNAKYRKKHPEIKHVYGGRKNPICNECGVKLVAGDNWYGGHGYLCKPCWGIKASQKWRKEHPEIKHHKGGRPNPVCRRCGVKLTVGNNWYSICEKHHNYICSWCSTHRSDEERRRKAQAAHKKNQEIKCAILTQYGPSHELACFDPKKIHVAPFRDIRGLQLHHVEHNGVHERKIKGQSLYPKIYKEFQRTGVWPAGYQTVCATCNHLLELDFHGNKSNAKYHALKERVFSHYPNKNGPIACADPYHIHETPVTDIRILLLDHMNGDGGKQRLELWGTQKGGLAFYQWLEDHGYPNDPRLQPLCWNCSQIKKLEEKEH